jgi:hypothetical protein
MSHGRQHIDNRFILQDFYRVLAPEGVILASHSGPCEGSLKSNRDFRRSAPLVGCAEMPRPRNRRRRAFWLVTTCASRNRSRSVRRRNTIAGLAARACQFPDAAAREVRRSAPLRSGGSVSKISEIALRFNEASLRVNPSSNHTRVAICFGRGLRRGPQYWHLQRPRTTHTATSYS